jgi:hypothetical protein
MFINTAVMTDGSVDDDGDEGSFSVIRIERRARKDRVDPSIFAPTPYKSFAKLRENGSLSMRQEAYYLVIQSHRAVHKLIIIITQLLNYDICDPLTRLVECFSLTVFWVPARENNSVHHNLRSNTA